jgi:ribosomal protein S27E
MEALWNGQAHLAQGRSPYARHRPEETLLYQVIDDNYPDFVAWFEAQGRTLPRFVRREFDDYLKCGRLEHGFLRVRCTDCHAEKVLAFSCKRRGFYPSCGTRDHCGGAVTTVSIEGDRIRHDSLPVCYARRRGITVPIWCDVATHVGVTKLGAIPLVTSRRL